MTSFYAVEAGILQHRQDGLVGALQTAASDLPSALRSLDGLARSAQALEPGDVLMVTRLNRLARSTCDLLITLAAITDRKAGFRSLGDAWADTTRSHGRLMLTVREQDGTALAHPPRSQSLCHRAIETCGHRASPSAAFR
ncbi:MAG: recombinase family protein [Acetobacteraceae bacterium]